MLDPRSTLYRDTINRAAADAAMLNESGYACVYTRENGITQVRKSTGVAGEVFAGFNLTRTVPPSQLISVIDGEVPATKKITLPRLPILEQLLVKVNDEKMEIVADSSALTETQVALSGFELTFHANAVAGDLHIVLAYEPTVSEAKEVTGDAPYGGLAEPITETTTLVNKADSLGTSFFDASCDWNNVDALHPKLGANGMLTLDGNGTVLENITIISAPSQGTPFLVVEVK